MQHFLQSNGSIQSHRSCVDTLLTDMTMFSSFSSDKFCVDMTMFGSFCSDKYCVDMTMFGSFCSDKYCIDQWNFCIQTFNTSLKQKVLRSQSCFKTENKSEGIGFLVQYAFLPNNIFFIYFFWKDWRIPPGVEVSSCIEDPLMAYDCCMLYGLVVVSLTHSPFSFSILHFNKQHHWFI